MKYQGFQGGFTKSWDGMGLLWDGHFSVAWWIRTIDFWVGVLRWSPKDDFSWVEKPEFSTKHQALFKKRFHGNPIRISHIYPSYPSWISHKTNPISHRSFPMEFVGHFRRPCSREGSGSPSVGIPSTAPRSWLVMGLLGRKSQKSEVGFNVFCMMIRGKRK